MVGSLAGSMGSEAFPGTKKEKESEVERGTQGPEVGGRC